MGGWANPCVVFAGVPDPPPPPHTYTPVWFATYVTPVPPLSIASVIIEGVMASKLGLRNSKPSLNMRCRS